MLKRIYGIVFLSSLLGATGCDWFSDEKKTDDKKTTETTEITGAEAEGKEKEPVVSEKTPAEKPTVSPVVSEKAPAKKPVVAKKSPAKKTAPVVSKKAPAKKPVVAPAKPVVAKKTSLPVLKRIIVKASFLSNNYFYMLKGEASVKAPAFVKFYGSFSKEVIEELVKEGFFTYGNSRRDQIEVLEGKPQFETLREVMQLASELNKVARFRISRKKATFTLKLSVTSRNLEFLRAL